MDVTLSIRAALLITVGVGLGYAKAVHDTEDASVRLERMEDKLDDILRYVKYRDVIEAGEPDIEEAEEVKEETPEGESS